MKTIDPVTLKYAAWQWLSTQGNRLAGLELATASGAWQGPFKGKRGGTFWVSKKTGHKVYSQSMPGERAHAKENFKDSGEGPFDSRGEAKQFGKAEVGAPWHVVKKDGKHHVHVLDDKGDAEGEGKPAGDNGTMQGEPHAYKLSAPAELVASFPVVKQPTTPPPPGGPGEPLYDPHVTADHNGDGVADAARVGVPAHLVPPPPKHLPRLPNLTEEERRVENDFATRYEADPDGMVKAYNEKRLASKAPLTFETDAGKDLDPNWNPPKEANIPKEQVMANRARYNNALHQTANAVVKRAFLQHLDTLQGDKKHILVTVGGCGSGKGYSLGKNDTLVELQKAVGAVWDSAGDQCATENPWIQEECDKRGIKCTYFYVRADPFKQWADPEKGVVSRAKLQGRMVDGKVFTDSYVLGAKNHHAFWQKNKDKADFYFCDNSGEKPQQISEFPKEDLSLDHNKLYTHALQVIKGRSDINDDIKNGATQGLRIWRHS